VAQGLKAAVTVCTLLLIWTFGALAQPVVGADAKSHVGKAVQMMEHGLLKEAAGEFERALAIDPNDDVVRLEYATCLFAQARDDEARKQFEIERQRLGDRPGVNYYLGRLDLRSGDFAAAIKKLAPLESDPALANVSLYLGMAYTSAGQPARALECLERAARKNPRDPEVHYRLARVYSTAGRANDANREYKLYRDWTESQRVAEKYGRECGEALRTQPIAQARLVCRHIADPRDSHRLILLGELYSQNGAFSDAIDPLRQAVKLDPESFEAWHGLGLSLFFLKRYQEALPPLQTAARLSPQDFSTLSLLASTLHAAGNDAAALPVLETAHSLNPDDAKVTARLEQLRAQSKAKP
jgi:tetratricopeptide (TPR) repeat protein